jgi:rRNA-processing protein FCF1
VAIDWLWGDKVNNNLQSSTTHPNRAAKIVDVILDTNALLMFFQFKLNLEAELDRLLGVYRVVIPSVVVTELEKLSTSVPEAKAALQLSKKYEIIGHDPNQLTNNKSGDNADLAIIALASQLKAIVVTNDKILRTNLKSKNLKTIYLKSKTHLVMD